MAPTANNSPRASFRATAAAGAHRWHLRTRFSNVFIPPEIFQHIVLVTLNNDGKWIKWAGDHAARPAVPWWRCMCSASGSNPACDVHGQGLHSLLMLNREINREVSALIEDRATWFLIDSTGVHAMTRFQFSAGKLPHSSQGVTISVKFVGVRHIIECWPDDEEDRWGNPWSRFYPEILGTLAKGPLGVNTRALQTRENVFAFLRDHLPRIKKANSDAMPKLSFLLEISRGDLGSAKWSMYQTGEAALPLIQPFCALKLGYAPAFEVWPARPPRGELRLHFARGYNPRGIGRFAIEYSDPPEATTSVESHKAWFRWHWRWQDQFGGLRDPESEADLVYSVGDQYWPWSFYCAQGAIDRLVVHMKHNPAPLSEQELDRSWVQEVIECVHSASHYEEHVRIWLLTKALLLSTPLQEVGHDDPVWVWYKELQIWKAKSELVKKRGPLPDIEHWSREIWDIECPTDAVEEGDPEFDGNSADGGDRDSDEEMEDNIAKQDNIILAHVDGQEAVGGDEKDAETNFEAEMTNATTWANDTNGGDRANVNWPQEQSSTLMFEAENSISQCWGQHAAAFQDSAHED